MSHAMHVLNTVTVPYGQQMGTDSGKGTGSEGTGDYTRFAVVYDHMQKILYWRSSINQNLQRLRLADVRFEEGCRNTYLSFHDNELPFFNDAAASMRPVSGSLTRKFAV